MKPNAPFKPSLLALSVLSAMSTPLLAEEAADTSAESAAIEQITVIGRSVSFANNATDEGMLKQ